MPENSFPDNSSQLVNLLVNENQHQVLKGLSGSMPDVFELKTGINRFAPDKRPQEIMVFLSRKGFV